MGQFFIGIFRLSDANFSWAGNGPDLNSTCDRDWSQAKASDPEKMCCSCWIAPVHYTHFAKLSLSKLSSQQFKLLQVHTMIKSSFLWDPLGQPPSIFCCTQLSLLSENGKTGKQIAPLGRDLHIEIFVAACCQFAQLCWKQPLSHYRAWAQPLAATRVWKGEMGGSSSQSMWAEALGEPKLVSLALAAAGCTRHDAECTRHDGVIFLDIK